MMRISPHHSEDIAMLPCDFKVASQKRLSVVIVLFSAKSIIFMNWNAIIHK